MDDVNKDEILANFQAVVPHLEAEVAVQMLEATGWSLEEAINVALASGLEESPARPHSPAPLTPTNGAAPAALPFQPAQPLAAAEENPWDILRAGMDRDVAGTSAAPALLKPSSSRNGLSGGGGQLSLNLHFRGRLVHLPELPASLTVAQLKARIAQDVCAARGRADDLHISGWVKGDEDFQPPEDLTLKELDLSSGAALSVRLEDSEDTDSTMDVDPDALASTLKFTVQDLHEGGCLHKFALPGAQTLAELKGTTRGLTGIPSTRQVWVGFPAAMAGDTVLAAVPWQSRGESLEEVSLSVDLSDKVSSASSAGPSHDASNGEGMEESDEEDAYSFLGPEHAASAEFLEEDAPATASNTLPLIPTGMGGNPGEAIANFTAVFESRFPSKVHPAFYQGSLGEAMAATAADPTRERRPLAVFLINDAAVAANIFCEQVLCAEQVSTLLTANFVVWPWDVTQKENADLLLNWAAAALGGGGLDEAALPMALRQGDHAMRFLGHMAGGGLGAPVEANFVRHLMRIKDQAPFLLLLGKNRGSWELLGQVKGSASAAEALEAAMVAMEQQHGMAVQEAEQRKEAVERAAFRTGQESEYEAIQRADKEKAEERQRQELLRQAEEKRARLAEEAKETELATLVSLLPDEPPEDSPEPLAQLRIRCPDGQVLSRRFLAAEPLQTLLTFTATEGFPAERFRLLTSYPKKDLSEGADPAASLQDLKLAGRQQLTLDEK